MAKENYLTTATLEQMITAIHRADLYLEAHGVRKHAVRGSIRQAIRMIQADRDKHKEAPLFDGPDYNPVRDDRPMLSELRRVFDVLKDGKWHSLSDIAKAIGKPGANTAGISARVRDLRKPRFGCWIIDRECRNENHPRLRYYRMRNPDGTVIPPLTPLPPRSGDPT